MYDYNQPFIYIKNHKNEWHLNVNLFIYIKTRSWKQDRRFENRNLYILSINKYFGQRSLPHYIINGSRKSRITGAEMAGGGTTLEYTPTWVVALVCSVIVSISFAVERLLHRAGKVIYIHICIALACTFLTKWRLCIYTCENTALSEERSEAAFRGITESKRR